MMLNSARWQHLQT